MRRFLPWLLALAAVAVVLAVLIPPGEQSRSPLVLAASSMAGALDEAADAWAARGHARPILSYAASSTLARQAMAGAEADLLVTADQNWMDEVATADALMPGTRADLVANRLVLIAPRASRMLKVCEHLRT